MNAAQLIEAHTAFAAMVWQNAHSDFGEPYNGESMTPPEAIAKDFETHFDAMAPIWIAAHYASNLNKFGYINGKANPDCLVNAVNSVYGNKKLPDDIKSIIHEASKFYKANLRR